MIENEEIFDSVAKPQSVCPDCGYRHNHSVPVGTLCDVCLREINHSPSVGYPQLVESHDMSEAADVLVPTVTISSSGLSSSVPDVTGVTGQYSADNGQHGCHICAHPDCDTINTILYAGTASQRALGRRYKVSTRTIAKHRLNCLHLPPQTKQDAAAHQRGCKICRHPNAVEINDAIKARVAASALKREYATSSVRFSDKAIAKHRKKCLGIPEGLPRGNRSGNPRGLQAVALRAQAAQDVDVVNIASTTDATPQSQPLSFAAHVAAEIERLVALRELLTTELAALADQKTFIERQYVILRSFQEAAKEALDA